MSQTSYDYSSRMGTHPISWEDFHGICKALALSVSRFGLEIVLPVGRGGYDPGTLLAHLLQIEVYPVRLSRRVNDLVTYESPQWILEPPAQIAGHRVLLVDEICDSGETILVVKEKALALGAAVVRSAVLYAHTKAVDVPDYIGIITDELLLNPWDREILRDGEFQFHPEYVEALSHQGLEAGPDLLIPANGMRLAKEQGRCAQRSDRKPGRSLKMSAENYPYVNHMNILYDPLQVIDIQMLVDPCTDPWYNQTLCQVNESVVRLGIFLGEYHWHKHDKEDEFFLTLDGKLLIDLEGDESVEVLPHQGYVVPKGVVHRTRAPQKTVVLMIETAGIVPTGDA